MSALIRNWKWIVATLVIAAIAHVASVFAVPRFIMWRTMAVIARNNGVNTMAYPPRPTPAARGVVRPSPDLLYSTCVFDLSHGPVRVHAAGMPDTYWSVSLFDAETNNFYVINDRQAKSGGVDFVIVPPHQDPDPRGTVVRAPGLRGLILFRTLIDDERHLADIDRARRGATCGPYDTSAR
jgi:uncharacterized membrane protein